MSALSDVEDVLFGFYDWLDRHRSETVILSFQYEGSTQPGASNSLAVQQKLFNVLTTPAARHYFLQTKDELGTLGAARGKLVLFRRFDLDKMGPAAEAALPGLHLPSALWPDNSPNIELVYNAAQNLSAFVEDYYETSDLPPTAGAAANIAAKLAAVTAHLAKAAGSDHPDSLFLTFASGEHNAATPPVYPQTMALGDGSDAQGGVNQQLVPFLRTLKGKRAGIVILDFFDQPPELVQAILDL